jgi:hypothetical protein
MKSYHHFRHGASGNNEGKNENINLKIYNISSFQACSIRELRGKK